MTGGEAIVADDRRFRLLACAGAVVVALVRFFTIPRTFWEFDELLFAWGVLDFDPRNHHPHPPGYPLVIGLGKALNLVAGDPFNALVALSFLSSVIGFVALMICFRNITGDSRAAILGSLLFALSPAMLVDGPLPMSDPPALLFLFLALMLASSFPERLTNRSALLFGVFCAASIGCRPQFAVPILPMFFFVIFRMRELRRANIALVAFAFACLGWLSPLIGSLGGGVGQFITYETRQATYVASHDASISRGAHSTAEVALRFIAHPWGPKWLALPVLLLAAVGAVRLARARPAKAIPLLIVTVVHLIFCFVSMDPADGVRYALPALAGVALLVAFSFSALADATEIDAAPLVFVILFAVGGFLYAREIILTRHSIISPPLQAVAFARRNLPPRSILLYETSLRPHAELLLGRFHPLPIDRGLGLYADRPEVPLYIFADGDSTAADAVRFSWPASDAYGKLTRDHYRVVSLIPMPPSRRYRPGKGIYPFERTVSGKEWRWLDQHAELELAAASGKTAAISFYLPPDAPEESTSVVVSSGSARSQTTVRRGATASVRLPISDAQRVEIAFDTATAFVPASAIGNRDPRHLAVQLVSIERGP